MTRATSGAAANTADIAHTSWEGNTAGASFLQGGVNNAVFAGAFGQAGTNATEAVVNCFNVGGGFPGNGDVIDFSVGAWGTGPADSGGTDGNIILGLTEGNATTLVPGGGGPAFDAFFGTPVQGGQTIAAGVTVVELNVNQSSPLALAQYLHGNAITFAGAGLAAHSDAHMLWAYENGGNLHISDVEFGNQTGAAETTTAAVQTISVSDMVELAGVTSVTALNAHNIHFLA